MAITTLAGVKSGLQAPMYFTKDIVGIAAAVPSSTWTALGGPPQGGFNGTLNGVTCSKADTGALPYINPNSGNSYLTRFQMGSGRATSAHSSAYILCDRLWHNGGYDVTLTSDQVSTTPTWPARDENGSTNGAGVLLGMEVSATVGAANPTITATYTNSAGTTGHSTTQIVSSSVSGYSSGLFIQFGLQAGDVGVRALEKIALSTSWLSGTVRMVAYRPIAILDCLPQQITAMDAISGAMPRIYDDSCLFLLAGWAFSGTTSMSAGFVQTSWG